MRKLIIFLIVGLAAALLASLTVSQVGVAFAQEVPPVGVVIAYVPEQSITIVDQNGNQHEYMISSALKIMPPGRADSLEIGSFVTIIAPASLNKDKQVAVGIVIHPHIPNGWTIPSLSATPLPTGTSDGTVTSTPSGTIPAPETATLTLTVTETPIAGETATGTLTETATPPPDGTPSDTPTPFATPSGGGSSVETNTLIEWLRSLLQQILTSR